MTDVPILLTATVVLACLALPLAVGAVLHRGARAAGLGHRRASRLGWTAGLVLAAWLAVTAAVGGVGLYAADPWLGIGVALPLVLGLLALRLSAVTAALSDVRAPAALAAVQVVRVVGVVFLALLALDLLPPGFAVPAGTGDVLVGLLAPVVAYALWRRQSRPALGIAFNALGLLDLVVAIPLGLLHAPGRLQLIVTEPTAGIMGLLPMALIPTFVVPLAIVLHVASLRLLVGPGRPDSKGDVVGVRRHDRSRSPSTVTSPPVDRA
ncbi:MAG: hypothetical protein GEU96_07335 [Propionibacteriales bacterium]|nr:hypothetical protein [Propionibacteriales bacterium]